MLPYRCYVRSAKPLKNLFHGYIDRKRLCPIFLSLKNVFERVNVPFFPRFFLIFGVRVTSSNKKLLMFLNYVLSEAKLSIFLSRKAKKKGKPQEQCNVSLHFQSLISTQLKLEFNFCSNNANLNAFAETSCVGKMAKVNENVFEIYL